MPFEVSTTCGMLVALTVPSSGIETWKSDSSSSRNASNSSSARSISSISSTGGLSRRIAASNGRSSRYFSEKIWSSIVSGVAAMRLDREQLPLVVPLIERGGLVQPLIALQADQLGRMHGGERLGDLGLADAGLAFQQQRPPQPLHQRDRGRKLAVGDVAGLRRGLLRFRCGLSSSMRDRHSAAGGGGSHPPLRGRVEVRGKPQAKWIGLRTSDLSPQGEVSAIPMRRSFISTPPPPVPSPPSSCASSHAASGYACSQGTRTRR